ncbi:MAG: hypothetical protein HOO88_05665 [Kiritimatiellaceae bacterium]|nr:hypothetical protein [Kiritimatiellaceae bacterium]
MKQKPKAYSLKSMVLAALLLVGNAAFAAGIASTHSLNSGTVAITNTQKRSTWVPVALLFRFAAPASGTITVERRTGSTAFLLTGCTLSNNQHAVWVPEADIPFNENDSLNITSTITNGTVEIIRKGE